mmetsp:Transcript_28988/g.63841  ORF Transcript_28988/g.63841 Transcript_28988/m.63841 type:complete len:563 (-) Transcript_28988:40-1728(-)
MEPRKPTAVEAKLLLDVVSILPSMVEAMVHETGQVTEKMYDDCNFAEDTGFNGKVYSRPDGAGRVHMQRAKIINAPKQNEMEAEKQRLLAEEALAAKHLAYESVEAKLAESRKTASALLSYGSNSATDSSTAPRRRERRGNQRILSTISVEACAYAKMPDGKKMTVQNMKAFIHVRRYSTLTKPKDGFKWPNLWPSKKKDIAEVKACINAGNFNACLISMLHYYRSKPVLLKSLPNPAAATPTTEQHTSPSYEIITTVARPLSDSFEKPSSLNDANGWFARIDSIVKGVNAGAMNETTIALADKLFSLMKTRHLAFEGTVLSKREVDSQAGEVCMGFFKDNIHLFSLMHASYGHVKSDLSYESQDTCLLQPAVDAFVPVEGDIAKLEGVYCYTDIINSVHRRVGKTDGLTDAATFYGRDCAHIKNAARKSLDGGVYSKYPSIHAEKICKASMTGGGRWETHLKMHCVIGFNRCTMTTDQKNSLLPDKPDDTSSLFVWNKRTLEYINEYCKRNEVERLDIQFSMLNYALEHSAKLLLSTTHNLSGTHGFEKFMVPQLSDRVVN